MRRALSRSLLSVLAAVSLASCATTNTVRWTYGRPSIWPPPEPYEEETAIRAVAGAPLILTAFAWDAVTWPFQLAFGVWPMWGDASTQMKPPDVAER